ncbi:S-layer family protein [Paenibacillus cellulosilyticus]|uniref:S-layer family protein n=1 Tax=Paenibacillus cellulosilyticus TaxID=375489 RepID=A0A2V2YM35_9BACL|nr:S-layer homology domain-containing protein [Paenibacillus cellulosilyticus]PWV95345.1 S-layer family protein [Paenibacillus cellulosilyticus]QKS44046.1 S-layer homology domain-containing protein [Paenibacillus cellulosilyticus]
MFKRCAASVIAFLLLFTLALPVQAETTEENAADSTVTEETQPVDNPESEVQSLPLPEAEVQQEVPIMNPPASVEGFLILGAMDGYAFNNGSFTFHYTEENGDTTNYYSQSFNGMINVSELPIPPKSVVTLSVSALFNGLQSDNSILYIDEIKMTREDLINLDMWDINPNAILAPLDASSITFSNAMLQAPNDFRTTNLANLSILTTQTALDLSIRGEQEHTGYLVTQSFPIVPNAALTFNPNNVNTASTLVLPDICQSTSIANMNMYAGFSDINKLVVNNGVYSIYCTKHSEIEGGDRTTTWSADQIDVTGNKQLLVGPPELNISWSSFSADSFWIESRISNGDFQLNSMTDLVDGEYKEQIQSKIKITDSKNVTVYESEGENWRSTYHNFEPLLSSDTYTFELTVTYPGLTQPLSIKKSINIYNPNDYTGKGIIVQAENEAGQPLQNMQVQVFEKIPPYIGNGDNDGTQYYSEPAYTSSISKGEALVIPSSLLVVGRSYDVIVTGTSSNSQHTVMYKQSVTNDTQQLQLKAANLKHVTVSANYATSEDTLVIAMIDDYNNSIGWPFASRFQNNHQSDLYIQTDSKLSMITNLYDESSDTGYLLSNSVKLSNDDNQSFSMNGATVQIQLPTGYDNAKLKVSSFDYSSKYEANRYVVTQGMNITASYYVESDGYRYSFDKGLGGVQSDVSLRFGREFNNRLSYNQIFAAGEVNQRVYTDYMDEQDNLLTDVAPLEIAKITDRVDSTSDEMTFMVGEADHASTMSVQSTDNGIAYTSVDPSDDGQSVAANGSIINYQMYDASNNRIGGALGTASTQEVQADIPALLGDYSLQISSQRFPDTLVKLSGQANITAGNSYDENALVIPIEPPTGYTSEDLGYGDTRLIPIKNPSSPITGWVSQGKIYFYDPSGIVASEQYALHMTVNLKTSNGTILYYNQVKLTGAQLLSLQQMKAPSNLVAVKVTDKLPNGFDLNNLRGEFPTIGSEDVLFDTDLSWSYQNSSQIRLDTILMRPQNFQLIEDGRNLITSYYHLKKQVQVNSAGGITSLTDLGTHRLQLQNKAPFIAFRSILPGTPSYLYSWNDSNLYEQAYVGPGNYKFMFMTSSYSQGEIPWKLQWITTKTYNMNQDTVIPFTGKVELSQSKLNFTQRTKNGTTTLSFKPAFISGGLALQRVETIAAGNGSYTYTVPAIITIKDSSKKKIYEAVSYSYDTDANYEITKTLADGTYTITFSQPIGPNDEVVLSKTFTVGSSVAGGGGGIPIVGGGGGVPSTSEDTSTENNSGNESESPKSKTFKSEDIPAAVNGTVTLPVQDSQRVDIAASLLKGEGARNKLVLTGDDSTITLPPEVLQQLSDLIGTDKLADAQISLSFAPVSEAQVTDAIQPSSGSTVKPVGPVYEFKLTITAKDGTPVTLSKFNAPITVAFEVDSDANKSLTNVYYIADDGALTYVPGHWENGKLVAQISHFSQYGVLEAHRSFADISATHWAHDAIEQLAARQIVQGVSDNTFAPNRKITRAEFTAMIVNALGLTSSQPATFSDVPSTAWYAEAVAAAFENNLIKGISASEFAPNKSISREEMAVIIVNALKLKQAALQTDAKPVSFNDTSAISSWASEAVNTASANGLINGNGTGGFNPRGMTTRAEAAQVLMKLITLLEQ